MKRKNFGLSFGHVFRKLPQAKYTYIYCCTVSRFIMRLLGNLRVADVVAPVVNPLINLLSDPECRLIHPIKIDYNYIEVTPYGRCFNIKMKCFQQDPEDLNGSPRAYVIYDREEGDIPYPKMFVDGKFLKIEVKPGSFID